MKKFLVTVLILAVLGGSGYAVWRYMGPVSYTHLGAERPSCEQNFNQSADNESENT